MTKKSRRRARRIRQLRRNLLIAVLAAAVLAAIVLIGASVIKKNRTKDAAKSDSSSESMTELTEGSEPTIETESTPESETQSETESETESEAEKVTEEKPKETAENKKNTEKLVKDLDYKASFSYDINSDGKKEEVSFQYENDLDGDYLQAVVLDGKKHECVVDNPEITFIHTAEDKSYLYIREGEGANDWFDAYVYAVTNGTFKEAGTFDFVNYCEIKSADRIVMGKRVNLLTTQDGSLTYHVGKNGMPVCDDDTVYFDECITYDVIKEFDAESWNLDKGKKAGTVTIKKGTVLEWIAAKDDYAFLKTDEGIIIRLKVKNDGEGSCTINGLEAGEYLEGIFEFFG